MTESERTQTAKKITQRSKQKASSYLVTDLSTISLPYEFDFHPFQPSTMCQWPGGVGFDSIYADMVSYTMYSSSDFPLINGFINLNSRVNREYDDNETILDITMKTNYDLIPLREAIKDDQECNHLLGKRIDRCYGGFSSLQQDVKLYENFPSTKNRRTRTSIRSTNVLSSTVHCWVLKKMQRCPMRYSAMVAVNYAMIHRSFTFKNYNRRM